MTDPHWRRRLLEVLFPALLAPLQLGLFGPHTIYTTNPDEFTAAFGGLFIHLLPAVLIVAAALVGIGLLLPSRLFRGYVVALFAFGLLLWAQGNLLVADYGPLDGGGIAWEKETWRNPYEIALWIVVPVLAVVAANALLPAAVFGSRVFLALQVVWLTVSAFQSDALGASRSGPSAAMFEISTTRNVFHIVLDSFQSDAFLDLVEQERPKIDRSFSGFVFFADHAGAFPTTMVSIPAMLTGTVYRNQEPLQEYIPKHFRNGSLFSAMRAQQYRVDSITELSYDSSSATRFFRMPRPYVSYEEYTRFASWQLADLALFRHVPHVLRPWVFNDQRWRLQAVFGERYSSETLKRRYHSVNGEVVLAEFARRMTPAVEGPVYKFMHVGIPHPPVTLTGGCAFIRPGRFTRENYAGQVRCAVTRVEAILDRLRELGLYDSSLIVISSDHGVRLAPREFARDRSVPGDRLSEIAGRAMALLIVKAPNSTGPLRVSYAPTSISDIPATVLDASGLPTTLPGQPALKLDEAAPRERSFAHYVWEDGDWRQTYFEYLDVFRINGRLRDGESWQLTETLYAPGADSAWRTRGLAEPHRSRTGVVYRWSDPTFFLHAPPDARGFELAVKSIAPVPQQVTVQVGNETIGRVTLSDQQWITLRHALPAAAQRASGWIEFRVDPPWRPRPDRSQELGVQTRDLKWLRESAAR
jgi:Sulfatase